MNNGMKRVLAVLLLIILAVAVVFIVMNQEKKDSIKRVLLADIELVMTMEEFGEEEDLIEKQESKIYKFRSESALELLHEIVLRGGSLYLKTEKIKPVVVEVEFGDRRLVLQGNYLIMPYYASNAAIRLSDKQSKELWDFMETFQEK